MVKLFYFCLWLLISSGLCGKIKERNFKFVIDKFEFKSKTKELFEENNCKVTQLQNRSYLNCYFKLLRNVDRFDLESQLDMLRLNNQLIHLYKVRMDGCLFLSTVHKNPLVNILAKRLMKVSNLDFQCPLKSHFNYTVHNWHMVETDFPSYTPECQLRGNTKFFTNNKMALIMNFWGSIVHNK